MTRNANGEAMRNAQGQLIWDPNVLYVQFRNQLTEDHDGVYLVYMNENTKITNLVDCGCHTASMRDAQLAWVHVLHVHTDAWCNLLSHCPLVS